MKRVILLFCVLFGVCLAQQLRFTADVEISGIPGMSGIITGKMWYDYPAKLRKIAFNMQGNGKPIEVIDFNLDKQVRYLGCGTTITCDAESYKSPMPIFHLLGTDTSPVTGQSWACAGSTAYTRVAPNNIPVIGVSFVGSNICSAKLEDGTLVRFTNVVAQTSIPSTEFSVASWNCPAKQCNIQLDIALVLDTSGSVGSQWSTEKSFAVNLVNSFTISEQAVKVGLVTFSTGSSLQFRLLNSKTSIVNGINAASYEGDATCIGCGLRTAKQSVLLASGSRTGVQQLIILVTDGKNNVGSGVTDIDAATTNAKLGGTWVFSIGVTTSIDEAQLKKVASGTNGFMTLNGNQVQTYFSAPTWSDLAPLIQGLVTATCQDLTGNPCGAGCNGFCSCGKQCICPDKCDDSNKCKNSQCSAAANGAGCYYTDKNCVDDDACTTDTCDTTIGCINTPFTTCPTKLCNTGKCVSPVGCVYTPLDCDDKSTCTADSCNAQGNCVHTVVFCDRCQLNGLNATVCQQGQSLCESWDCIQPNLTYAGCKKISDTNCDDQNACTTDSCNPLTGNCSNVQIICDDNNECTIDSCDPDTGCSFVSFNATEVCNDFSVCTNDTCDPLTKCVNTPIPCPYGGPCVLTECNSLTGCVYPSIVCEDIPEFKAKIGDCYVAKCNDISLNISGVAYGCFLEQQQGTTVDSCGVCNGDGQSCLLGIGVAAVAGIGAGLVAAIIIGIVAAVAIVGAVAGKKGYDAYMKNKRDMGAANNNALYKDPGSSGNNPFYSEMTAK